MIGASRGIGRAVAAKYLSEGFLVAGTHRGSGVDEGVHGIEADVTNEKSLVEALRGAVKHLGRLDVLVYSAGMVRQDLLVRMRVEDVREVIDTNLIGAFIACREALRVMMRQRSGSIVLISSESSRAGIPGASHYTASKAGLEGLARSAMWESGPFGVRVNVVAPGATDTDMMKAVSEENLKSLLSRTPLRRMAHAEEIAESVFQISQLPHVSGAVHVVSGGEGLGH
nr:SDR family NAD(P)-dependent oxidoreductase [Acaricomes phytoseiuli]